jgi:hypothetical protein
MLILIFFRYQNALFNPSVLRHVLPGVRHRVRSEPNGSVVVVVDNVGVGSVVFFVVVHQVDSLAEMF